MVKFIYSEAATKFCEIFHLLLTVCTVVKSKGKISQNFVAFSEYMNFNQVANLIFETKLFDFCTMCTSKRLLKFIYSEKATKFCEIFPLLLTVCTVVKSKGKISQNFVAFSE